MTVSTQTAYHKLFDFISRHNFKGYDPYDGNHTRFGLLKKYYPTRLVLTYLNKFSPVNFRPLLGISRSESNQTLAFLMRAVLTHNPGTSQAEEFIQNTLNHFITSSQKKIYGEHAWYGLDFPVQMLKPKTPFDHSIPDVIATEACALAILQYAQKEHKYDLLKEYITGVVGYFMKHHLVESGNNTFFKYYPDSPLHQVTYNASIIAAVYLLEVDHIEKETTWTETAKKAIDFVVNRQHPEGYWNYRINLKTGEEKQQIDFHQGFILDALLRFIQLEGNNNPVAKESYKKGLEFYHKKQFLPNGQGIYRYPRKWPVNIHNQAQGIITFTRAAAAGFGEKYHHFARTIAQWTIQNMQDKDGHFYFLKYPLFTNKIPYIRWSDAAMAYALAVLLKYEKKLQ